MLTDTPKKGEPLADRDTLFALGAAALVLVLLLALAAYCRLTGQAVFSSPLWYDEVSALVFLLVLGIGSLLWRLFRRCQ